MISEIVFEIVYFNGNSSSSSSNLENIIFNMKLQKFRQIFRDRINLLKAVKKEDILHGLLFCEFDQQLLLWT